MGALQEKGGTSIKWTSCAHRRGYSPSQVLCLRSGLPLRSFRCTRRVPCFGVFVVFLRFGFS